jgi:thiamine monophosphate kinase
VEGPDANGEIQRWAVEWATGAQLARQGVTRETIKPGDHLIITGSPARNAANHRLRTKTIVRPSDGWNWVDTFD